jgi:hypothetical protein
MAAVGLLAGQGLSVLRQGFRRFYRIDERQHFSELLARIDAAEQHCRWKAK